MSINIWGAFKKYLTLFVPAKTNAMLLIMIHTNLSKVGP